MARLFSVYRDAAGVVFCGVNHSFGYLEKDAFLMRCFTLDCDERGQLVIDVRIVNPSDSSISDTVKAIIDTGAEISALHENLVAKLGLPDSGKTICIQTASVPEVHKRYFATLELCFPEGDNHHFSKRDMVGGLASDDYNVLIGLDILKNCKLVYEGKFNKFTIGVY